MVFCVFRDDINIFSWREKLSLRNRVFQAQFFAIISALVYIAMHRHNHRMRWAESDSDSIYLISTDSLSGLYVLNRFNVTHYFLIYIIRQLQHTTKHFLFNLVNGPSRVQGNELEDQLVKSAISETASHHTFFLYRLHHRKWISNLIFIRVGNSDGQNQQ